MIGKSAMIKPNPKTDNPKTRSIMETRISFRELLTIN